MNIAAIDGSHVRNGSSDMLVSEFVRGAKEAGHEAKRIDAACADIGEYTGSSICGYEGPRIQKDDAQVVRTALLGADMVVFVTSLYYYGITVQFQDSDRTLLLVHLQSTT